MFNDFEMKFTNSDKGWELKYLHIFNGIYISDSENDYKKNKKTCISNPEFHFTKEVFPESNEEYHVLRIKGSNEDVFIRAQNKISLEYIVYNSIQTNEKDFGRPMTFIPHLVNIESVLEKGRVDKFNFKGLINLVVIALVFSHIRLIFDSFKKYGFLVTLNVFEYDHKDFLILAISAYMNIFSIVLCFLIERLAAQVGSKKENLITICHTFNIIVLLSLPIFLHKFKLYNPALVVFCLFLTVIVCLKLISYAHFWNDVRKFIYRRNRQLENVKKDKISDDKSQENNENALVKNKTSLNESLYDEIHQIINKYPENVRFYCLVEFLFLPVLCFQFKFPRTNSIRKQELAIYGIKILFCLFFQYFIIVQWIVPVAKNAVIAYNNEDYLTYFEKLVKISIPNLYLWLIMFYSLFHCTLNFMGELTKFGDRQFYKDWWNSSFIDEYWRNWNLPTHYWLMRHVYNPIRRKKINKFLCMALVFLFSALFHEYLISGALGKVHYSSFWAMFLNFPISLIQQTLKKFKLVREDTVIHNIFFWISFCFLGQPLIILLYFQSYYKENPQFLN